MGWPLFSVILFPLTTYSALRLWRSFGAPSQNSLDFYPEVEITKESAWFLLNLAVVNDSVKEVWAEECLLSLSECDGVPSNGFQATYQGVLRIGQFARPGETLRTGLCRTVYEAAGRPQDEYSFVIAGTLKYRVGHAWYSQSFQPCRVRMRGPHPIAVQKTRGRSVTSPGRQVTAIAVNPANLQ